MPANGNGAVERALELLEEAERCAKRLRRGSARREDLHRFRVNIRRLRVHLKIHDEACKVPQKLRERLRRAFRRTNSLRDAQIGLTWINGLGDRARHGRTDTGALAAEAARRGPRDLAPDDWKRFAKLAKAVRRTLTKRGRAGPDLRGFRKDCESAARRAFRKLARRIARLNGGQDAKALHKVRIAAKRLRYILEPLAGRVAGLPPLNSVKSLQKSLGDIHDLTVIEAELQSLRHNRPSLDAQATAAIEHALLRRAALLSRAGREWSKPVWRA